MWFRIPNRRLTSLTVMVCLFINLLVPFIGPEMVTAANQPGAYTATELASQAIQFINNEYQTGQKIDGYTAYVLTLAGEDLAASKWTKDNTSLKSQIVKLADLLGNNNSLLTYLLATQNTDGSFGPFANEYGTKAPLQALAQIKADLPVNEAVYGQVQASITRAIDYFQDRYQNGSLPYNANGWNLDYRCVEALVQAGEDLSVGEWVYAGKSLKDLIIASANTAASDPSGLDAVYLAKELTALYAVDPDSDKIDVLVNAIIDKQKTLNGTVYFGQSIYDDVVVLTALGKAGQLSKINQTHALNYLNGFKHEHKNAWGEAAGAAWGGFYAEEPDLTAQVLTALSYFEGAKDPTSDVYRAIQDGLTYLLDIQDAETGAIPHQWDSTFATAETLIALKALGKTYDDYAGSNSHWLKRSKTKTIAQCLLALNQWDETERINKLTNLLKERHSPNGFDNSVYSDMLAYLALGEAGKLSVINTVYARDYILRKQSVAEATYGSWGETWGTTYYPDFMSTAQAIRALTYLPGYDNDQQVQNAINKGLTYLQSWQQNDGGVYVTTPFPEDPVVDTAELIITLKRLGQDPTSWKNAQGLNPVSYMMLSARNDDGSFGTSKNILDAAEALYTYLLLNGTVDPATSLGLSITPATSTVSPNDTQQFQAVMHYFNGTSRDVTNDAAWSVADSSVARVVNGLVTGLKAGQTVISATYEGVTGTAKLTVSAPAPPAPISKMRLVYIAVVGMNGELLYGPGSVKVSQDDRWGLTALGALDATGLDYDEDNGFVKSIAGQANRGMNGWMYKVNGSVPMVAASAKTVNDGDQVIWWYSTDINSPGPDWSSLLKAKNTPTQSEKITPADLQAQNKILPASLQASENALTALEKIEQLLNLKGTTEQVGALSEVNQAVAVVGSEQAMSRAEIAALQKELLSNTIDLNQKVAAATGATISDTKAEVALSIPANALKNDVEITVKKITQLNNGNNLVQAKPPVGYQQISAIYNFGPDGITFALPVTLNLKIALPPLVKPENLALAWYDQANNQWVAIPAVVDLSRGLILARIKHFSDYAVFAKENRKSFADVTDTSFSWAKDPIELLAGASIVVGVDGTNFEPARSITRAEFVCLLVKALGLEEKPLIGNSFIDVKTSDWYTKAVMSAAGAGLIKGYEDNRFCPDNTITREEVATILVRAMNLPATEENLPFTDSAKVSSWAKNSVATAAAHGLIKGFADGTFRPEAATSRAESAMMVYRMLTKE